MTMAPAWVEALVGALLLASGIASVLAGLGLVRLRTLFMRMHPPALASTLGVAQLGIEKYLLQCARVMGLQPLYLRLARCELEQVHAAAQLALPFTMKHWAFAGRQPVSTNVELLDQCLAFLSSEVLHPPGSHCFNTAQRHPQQFDQVGLLEMALAHHLL